MSCFSIDAHSVGRKGARVPPRDAERERSHPEAVTLGQGLWHQLKLEHRQGLEDKGAVYAIND